MTTPEIRDEEWSRIADLSEEERQAAIRARTEELSQLGEEERQARIRTMSESEYALPHDPLRAVILSRIRVWLEMDVEVVRPVAASLDAVMTQMPGPIAMRRVEIVQTLARDFPAEQQERLHTLVPGAFPRSTAAVSMAGIRAEREAAGGAPPAEKKPWWQFWKQ